MSLYSNKLGCISCFYSCFYTAQEVNWITSSSKKMSVIYRDLLIFFREISCYLLFLVFVEPNPYMQLRLISYISWSFAEESSFSTNGSKTIAAGWTAFWLCEHLLITKVFIYFVLSRKSEERICRKKRGTRYVHLLKIMCSCNTYSSLFCPTVHVLLSRLFVSLESPVLTSI